MRNSIKYGRWITAVVLIFGCAAFLVYDIWVLNVYGPDTTISAVINAYAYSYLGDKINPLGCFAIGFINGGFIIHFLKWGVKLDGPTENSNLGDKE